MHKDFNEFSGLSDDERSALFDLVLEDMGIDTDGDDKLDSFSMSVVFTRYSNRLMMETLRRYHEWMIS